MFWREEHQWRLKVGSAQSRAHSFQTSRVTPSRAVCCPPFSLHSASAAILPCLEFPPIDRRPKSPPLVAAQNRPTDRGIVASPFSGLVTLTITFTRTPGFAPLGRQPHSHSKSISLGVSFRALNLFCVRVYQSLSHALCIFNRGGPHSLDWGRGMATQHSETAIFISAASKDVLEKKE